METVNVPELVERLGSDEDAVRKMAVFKLQSNIGDPSFADLFIAEGGLTRLRYLTLHASGNTLAYSLTSFSRLLDVDKGWECVDEELVERIVELIVTHPLVNILRGAMSILVSIVSQPSSMRSAELSGFRALKPAIAIYPQFLEMLVTRLSSADHALCANALQLVNSLMRDSITHDSEVEWPKFIQKLQDLGVIRAVYVLMQDPALQDLTHPLIEFQSLTKVLLRKWRDIPLDQEKPEHRRALKGIHLASNPEKMEDSDDTRRSRKHHPEKWRRLGFESESPVADFHEVGFLGMMDLADYVRSHGDEFQKLLLEHSTKPVGQRCPVARASLAVTSILYEHFEVDKTEMDDSKAFISESRAQFDKMFQPLLLHWTRLHVAGLQAFFRLWKATAAEAEDLDKLIELVRILIESVVGGADRTKDVQDVEEDLADFEYNRLRGLQMELLELTYEDAWGHHLRQVREELQHEALQFVKEQRIRSLLQGCWFALDHKPGGPKSATYQYAQLSHNRRYLHFGSFDLMGDQAPELDTLPEKSKCSMCHACTHLLTALVDLSLVSSVVSNVSTENSATANSGRQPTTKITIHGCTPSPSSHGKGNSHTRSGSRATQKEIILLTLRPYSHSIASEWLDGLLMLLNQQPITAETTKLIDLVSNYGLKIRLLNVRFDDATFAGEAPPVPGREGLDEDYYYDVFGETTSPFALSHRPASPKSKASTKSLHGFFQPATEAQRWATVEKKPPEEVDLIEDDYDSYDEIFTQHLANERALSSTATQTREKPNPKPPKAKPKVPPKKPTKRFLLPSTRPAAEEPILEDRRPWAQRYAPDSLSTIAVHKKKVSDVQAWLEDTFAGRRSERLLVLRGPAGSGKTTTISLLSKSLGYDIIDWKNPPISEFGSSTYQSASAQFEEFLGRGDKFGGLDLDSDASNDKRILLIEEFPSMAGQASAHTAFRVSLQRYLAASGRDHPPVVVIVSETLLGSASSFSDNLTVHRLLGPAVYNHPGTTIIDYNSIAPTFMHKALRSILEREALDSKRAHIPGPAVLDRISEIGDIRSAISSLEFLCLKGDSAGVWGGSLAKKKGRAEVVLTAMEKETLRLVTQREASLGMFHAVGKIVYNKRMDPSLVDSEDIEVLPAPPDYLSHFHRPKASQVLVNDLIDETGTDISTFISALHENYLPSCHGDHFTDTFGECIEALSDSEILGTDRRSRGARAGVGTGINTPSGGVDALRQDEMSFQVATRGLLFALPYPVQRKVGSGGRRAGDAHKMLYPASLRLWRDTEEIEGLVDSWSHRLLGPSLASQSSELAGVSSWKSADVGRTDETHGAVTMMPRHDLLLHQLPYMAIIRRQDPDWWQLNKIVGKNRDAEPTPSMLPPPEEKLYLSDDDIVD
ncbi:unnamed protein product [Penicillium olsonii]|nr:unnamed protein product [Penicillium olsonii]